MSTRRRFTLALIFAALVHVMFGLVLLAYELTASPAQAENIVEIELSGEPDEGAAGGEQGDITEPSEQEVVEEDSISDDTVAPQENRPAKPVKKISSNTAKGKPGNGHGGGSGSGTGTGKKGTGSGNVGSNRPAIMPHVVYSTDPEYPKVARDRGISGVVYLRVLVNSSGSVDSASIKSSSGYGYLDAAALDVIYSWRFSPAKNELGESISCYVNLPVKFDLRR